MQTTGDMPYGNQEDWSIAFIDVETTGLIPGYHEMIDVGIVMADLEGTEQDSYFQRIMPEHPDRVQEEAAACNGFTAERWERFGAISPSEAVDEIMAFYDSTVPDQHVLMCAYNASFDHAFLDHLFRQAGESSRQLHNYVLDLPSLAWGRGFQDLHLSKMVDRLDVEDEPRASSGDEPWKHTGLTGAKLNARIYRNLLDISASPA